MIFLIGFLVAYLLKSSDNHTCSSAPSPKTSLNVAFHGYQAPINHGNLKTGSVS